jgi:formamidopyrimidine-DNA glycosylase
MPELPEVETVRGGLERLLGDDAVIARVELKRRDLRRIIPPSLPRQLAGQRVIAVRRRAKYLLIDTPAVTLLCHLGMTGSWRLAPPGDERPHDHCYLHLADGRRLAFRDPRRFGLLDLIKPGQEQLHPALADLGPEPLDSAAFHVGHLVAACRGRRGAIKSLIMDQRVVVGIGNIYAQEALFRARIHPARSAGRIPVTALTSLVEHLRAILNEAIAAGGSTISDFRQAGGSEGHFQTRFQIYGRSEKPCVICGARLRGGVIGGRGTTWCPRCQR